MRADDVAPACAAADGRPMWSAASLRQALHTPSQSIWLAWAGEAPERVEDRAAQNKDALAGAAWLSTANDAAELNDIFTVSLHRRQGVAAALLSACVTDARAKHCTHLILEVACDNAAAYALYRRFDFRRIHTRKGYYRGAHGVTDADVLKKVL